MSHLRLLVWKWTEAFVRSAALDGGLATRTGSPVSDRSTAPLREKRRSAAAASRPLIRSF